jgi:hypothetical protein
MSPYEITMSPKLWASSPDLKRSLSDLWKSHIDGVNWLTCENFSIESVKFRTLHCKLCNRSLLENLTALSFLSVNFWNLKQSEQCGDLPTPLVDSQTSWVYPSIPVQSLYISCIVTSAVSPLVVPPSTVVTPTRLYPLYCALYFCTLTLTCWHLQAQVPLSSPSLVTFRFNSTVCYNLAGTFRLGFHVEICKLLLRSFYWKLAVATTALNFEHVHFCCSYFCVLLLVLFAQFQLLHRFSTLGWHSTQRTF